MSVSSKLWETTLYTFMVNGFRSSDLLESNIGHGSKFYVGSRVRQWTPEEGWRTYRPKRCEYNDTDFVLFVFDFISYLSIRISVCLYVCIYLSLFVSIYLSIYLSQCSDRSISIFSYHIDNPFQTSLYFKIYKILFPYIINFAQQYLRLRCNLNDYMLIYTYIYLCIYVYISLVLIWEYMLLAFFFFFVLCQKSLPGIIISHSWKKSLF